MVYWIAWKMFSKRTKTDQVIFGEFTYGVRCIKKYMASFIENFTSYVEIENQ